MTIKADMRVFMIAISEYCTYYTDEQQATKYSYCYSFG